jgi:hypothetical protein
MGHPFFYGSQAVDVGLPGAPRYAYAAPLTGADEDSVTGTDTASAIALIERLLVLGPQPCVAPDQAAALSAGQRDRILAALHERVFGPRVAATLQCGVCEQPFDVAFMLPALCEHVRATAAKGVRVLPDGSLEHEGLRFRLPNGLDELEVATLPPDEAGGALAARCLDPSTTAPFERLEQAMTAVDPLIDLTLPATCAECGAAQSMRFAIQGHFLGSLTNARRRLTEDVHALASAYGWSRAEILAMRSATRREHVDLLAIALRRRSSA